jgi:hypothetical protein
LLPFTVANVLPAGHAHAAWEVEPTGLVKPDPHDVHDDAPELLYVPAAQFVHDDAPAALNVPAAQDVHDDPSVPYVPAAHETQLPPEG